MNKIGILYICTGKYTIFWKDFYLSMEKNFINDAEKHYFVFTDSSEIDFEKENKNIHRIYQENLGWPDNTLMRFKIFLKAEEELKVMDYLFFFNANLIIQENITSTEFLPMDNQNLLATIHPGFFDKDRNKFTYDRNKKSTVFIDKNKGEYYFAGGLNGGKTSDFIEAMKTMRDNVDIDKKNRVIALWHDESHWNKYVLERSDVKMLPPSYLYPEGSSIPFSKIILIRDKNKYGGHLLLRNEKTNNYKLFLNKIKKLLSKIYKKILTLNRFIFRFRKAILSNINEFKLNNINLMLITVAFNNSDIIKLQHSYIKQNLDEEFCYIVVDNSIINKISNDIYEYCLKNEIPYFKLPPNPFTNEPSKSHGIALNWAYLNIIKKYKPKFWGFIDHDILPIRKTLLTPFLNNGLFGLTQERAERWYIWPGFSFFKYDYVKNYNLDFMPYKGLDTGGLNYNILYKNIDKNIIPEIKRSYFNIETEEKMNQFDNSNNTVEIIGDWLHIMRTSNWDSNNTNNKLNNITNIFYKI